ncbi:hypothetical protein ACO2Q8_19525 [Larkinella sp. VNQ87]|uniref:hypothetical protein n=1 Tax=Larkinella sp. VNQ87 TaxID=3400921 RepID=UPI003C10BA38
MRKKTFALLILAILFVVACLTTEGFLSILSGLVALGLGLSAWAVQSAGWVDEKYNSIPDPDEPEPDEPEKPSED